MTTTTIAVASLIGTAAQSTVDQVMGVISTVVPIGLVVVGTVIAVTFGIKFIKKLTKG